MTPFLFCNFKKLNEIMSTLEHGLPSNTMSMQITRRKDCLPTLIDLIDWLELQ